MSPALANFLFEAANFLLLAALLGRFLFKPIRRALDSERERHENRQKEEDRLRAEAESVNEEARATREKLEDEAEQARQEIIASAKKQAEELISKSRSEQDAEREALRKELDAKRDAEASALADVVGRVAAEAVAGLLQSLSGPSLDSALVRGACEQLDALQPAGGSVLVESARTLSEQDRALLRDKLGDDFDERVVPELGAGVRVTTAAGQVDATAVSVSRQAAAAVRDASDLREAEPEDDGA